MHPLFQHVMQHRKDLLFQSLRGVLLKIPYQIFCLYKPVKLLCNLRLRMVRQEDDLMLQCGQRIPFSPQCPHLFPDSMPLDLVNGPYIPIE